MVRWNISQKFLALPPPKYSRVKGGGYIYIYSWSNVFVPISYLLLLHTITIIKDPLKSSPLSTPHWKIVFAVAHHASLQTSFRVGELGTHLKAAVIHASSRHCFAVLFQDVQESINEFQTICQTLKGRWWWDGKSLMETCPSIPFWSILTSWISADTTLWP